MTARVRASFAALACAVVLACNALLGHEHGTLEEAGGDAATEPLDPCAAWTPSTLAGLVVWLDGAHVDVDGGALARWPDQSGRGNDALLGPDVGKPTRPPTIHAGALNGLDAVAFSTPSELGGGQTTHPNLRIPDAPDLQWGTGGYALALVIAYANPAGYDEWGGYASVWSKVEDPWPYYGVALTANVAGILYPDGGQSIAVNAFGWWVSVSSYSAASGIISATGMNSGAFHVVVAERDATGKTLTLRVDGARTDLAVPPHETNAATIDVAIGGRPLPNAVIEPLAGEIAELLAVKGALTDADESCLEAYLRAKYAL